MSAFRIGQKVRCVRGPRTGAVTTITSGPLRFSRRSLELEWPGRWGLSDGVTEATEFQQTDIQVDLGVVAYPVDWLEPVYDGAEKTEWTESLRKLCRVKDRVPT